MDDDLITVVVLDYLDVPGVGAYLPGDVAGFEPSVAEALIQQRRVRRFQEVPPTTPAPSADTPPAESPKSVVEVRPTTLAPLPHPVSQVVTTSSPRAQKAVKRAQKTTVTAYLERVLVERSLDPLSWAKKVPVITTSSHRLNEAVTFLYTALGRTPKPVVDVLAQAQQRGISPATLRRAKRVLGAKAYKIGMREGWAWMIRDGTL